MRERIVLDPAAVADAGRTELDLTLDVFAGGALQIDEKGIEWGDAAIEAAAADGEYGSVVIDHTIPNRVVTIPLIALDTAAVSFDQARRSLQQWVGLVQRTYRGWLMREHGGQPRYLDVMKASLKMGGGTLQALGLSDADIVLTLETLPDWTGPEQLLGSARLTGGGVVRLATVAGDWPARMRAVIRDTSGNAQRSLLYATRPAVSDAAAAIDYAATALTRLSGTARTDHIVYSALPPTWIAVLSTDVSGVGKMSHVGPHRIWALVETTASAQVRLEWTAGSGAAFRQNAIVTLPTGATWVDLGQVQVPRAVAGTQQWEGRILANASGATLRIFRVVVLPTAYASGLVNATSVVPTSASVGAWDDFETQTSGRNLDGTSAPAGGPWTGGGTSTTPFSVSGGTAVWNGAQDTMRFAVLLGTQLRETDMSAKVTCGAGVAAGTRDSASNTVGIVARYVDANNWVGGFVNFSLMKGGAIRQWVLSLVTCVAGTPTAWALPAISGTYPGDTLRLIVGNGTATVYSGSTPLSISSIAALATGGALERGAPGLSGSWSRSGLTGGGYGSWDNFFVASAGAAAVDDAVLFANGQAQLTTAGYARADASGTAYASLPPIGTLPRLSPPAADLYVRTARAVAGQPLPSTAGGDVTVDVYGRPCFLFI